MFSSYDVNNYGLVFMSLILAKEPLFVVECGVLDGYSTLNIASALKFNYKSKGITSTFFSYDLFDDYEYRHGNYKDVSNMLNSNDLMFHYNLVKCDAFEASKNHKDDTIDFLHFDISNDGDILLKMLDVWGKKIRTDGIIAFEGGSIERDQGWIKKYNKKPIRPELLNNPEVYNNWSIQIFEEYPSLTLMWRK